MVGAVGVVVRDRRRRPPVAVRPARTAGPARAARRRARDRDRPDVPLAQTRGRSTRRPLRRALYVPPPDEGDPSPVDGTVFREADRLPVGATAFPGMEPNDLVLWVESHAALVAGDTLQDRGNGLQFLGDLTNNVPAHIDVEQVLDN